MLQHCYEVLMNNKLPDTLPGVVVLLGDESFLRSETLSQIAKSAKINLQEVRSFDGTEIPWSEVHDELATLSLFESDALRVAVVSNADTLISQARPQLEKWCKSPADGSVLIMHVDTLASNTNLYKLVDKHGWLISCTAERASKGKGNNSAGLESWISYWAQSRHELKLKPQQCRIIVDAVGPNCGLLHQELAKLALYAAEGIISDQEIRTHVGSWSTRTMWEIADAIMDGKIAVALTHLERVYSSGQHPAAIIPQIAWSLRRYGIAAQLFLQSRRLGSQMTLEEAVKKSGFWGVDLSLAPQRLRRIGLQRASQLLDWLLELDLRIKGSHSNTDRAIFALEELCFKFV